MKKTFPLKSLLVSMAVASSAAFSIAPATTQAEVTGNMGAVTQYYVFGLKQTDAAAAQGGIDYAHDSGFYLGTWASSLQNETETGVSQGQGIEYDFYGGWGGSFGDVDLGVGATYYGYSRDYKGSDPWWDSSYMEANLSLGYKFLSFDAALGEHEAANEKVSGSTNKDQSYQRYALTASYEGLSATYGIGRDFLGQVNNGAGNGSTDHSWYEISYSTNVADMFDASISYISTDIDKNDDTGWESDDDQALIFGVTKTFNIM
ncbi:MAG: TorF family putative porin [Hydrogenovibrio sp.]|uniref:TorF family putative porin n=1 Tax=Hydrogenovibrio sp. TaxID=2065821 RepID=UPI0028705D44|nr:TorF family putative porin [Hydrogenovibrio sp.]MDR9498571.1 TorF family putative porin [Hydrogenovibrio sp.]